MKQKCTSPTVLTTATIQEEELQGCSTEMIRTCELEVRWGGGEGTSDTARFPCVSDPNTLPFVFSQIICSVPVVGIVYKTKLYCQQEMSSSTP